MIERQTIRGREAVVAYLTGDFEPADKDVADLIKVVYDDGETAWLIARETNDQAQDAEWEESKHPRGQPDNPGQFASARRQG